MVSGSASVGHHHARHVCAIRHTSALRACMSGLQPATWACKCQGGLTVHAPTRVTTKSDSRLWAARSFSTFFVRLTARSPRSDTAEAPDPDEATTSPQLPGTTRWPLPAGAASGLQGAPPPPHHPAMPAPCCVLLPSSGVDVGVFAGCGSADPGRASPPLSMKGSGRRCLCGAVLGRAAAGKALPADTAPCPSEANVSLTVEARVALSSITPNMTSSKTDSAAMHSRTCGQTECCLVGQEHLPPPAKSLLHIKPCYSHHRVGGLPADVHSRCAGFMMWTCF